MIIKSPNASILHRYRIYRLSSTPLIIIERVNVIQDTRYNNTGTTRCYEIVTKRK